MLLRWESGRENVFLDCEGSSQKDIAPVTLLKVLSMVIKDLSVRSGVFALVIG
jgi:hypothetical protein